MMAAAAAGAVPPYGTPVPFPVSFHPAYYAAMATVNNALSPVSSVLVLVLQLGCEVAFWVWFHAGCVLHGRRACGGGGGGREEQEEELWCPLCWQRFWKVPFQFCV